MDATAPAESKAGKAWDRAESKQLLKDRLAGVQYKEACARFGRTSQAGRLHYMHLVRGTNKESELMKLGKELLAELEAEGVDVSKAQVGPAVKAQAEGKRAKPQTHKFKVAKRQTTPVSSESSKRKLEAAETLLSFCKGDRIESPKGKLAVKASNRPAEANVKPGAASALIPASFVAPTPVRVQNYSWRPYEPPYGSADDRLALYHIKD